MIDNDFYNIAKKMLASVSAGVGQEKIINKAFWNNNGILRVADGTVYYPTSPEVKSAFGDLIKNGVLKFRDCGGGNLGITLLKEIQFLSTFSHSTKPNV